jgi:hypothetical protein
MSVFQETNREALYGQAPNRKAYKGKMFYFDDSMKAHQTLDTLLAILQDLDDALAKLEANANTETTKAHLRNAIPDARDLVLLVGYLLTTPLAVCKTSLSKELNNRLESAAPINNGLEAMVVLKQKVDNASGLLPKSITGKPTNPQTDAVQASSNTFIEIWEGVLGVAKIANDSQIVDATKANNQAFQSLFKKTFGPDAKFLPQNVEEVRKAVENGFNAISAKLGNLIKSYKEVQPTINAAVASQSKFVESFNASYKSCFDSVLYLMDLLGKLQAGGSNVDEKFKAWDNAGESTTITGVPKYGLVELLMRVLAQGCDNLGAYISTSSLVACLSALLTLSFLPVYERWFLA